jgi:hypothetical protein
VRKALTWFLIVVFGIVFSAMPVFAGSKGCSPGCAKTCAAVKSCPTMKAMTVEECKKAGHKCNMVEMSIDGMSDSESESQISKALGKLDNVFSVKSVNHKDGKAVVCCDTKIDSKNIIETINNLGYKAKLTSVEECKIAVGEKKNSDVDAKSE